MHGVHVRKAFMQGWTLLMHAWCSCEEDLHAKLDIAHVSELFSMHACIQSRLRPATAACVCLVPSTQRPDPHLVDRAVSIDHARRAEAPPHVGCPCRAIRVGTGHRRCCARRHRSVFRFAAPCAASALLLRVTSSNRCRGGVVGRVSTVSTVSTVSSASVVSSAACTHRPERSSEKSCCSLCCLF
eukprot:86855-Chlamydomonas_euryale.AAC.2